MSSIGVCARRLSDDRRRRSPKDGASGADAPGNDRKRTSTLLEAVVLSILCASQAPLGAYVIARQARALGAPMAPNQVYRVLERLGSRVRRVETLNAFVEAPGPPGPLMLCRRCGRTDALEIAIDMDIERICIAAGFEAKHVIAEVVGTCPRCREADAHPI